jgi:hypothetical protein
MGMNPRASLFFRDEIIIQTPPRACCTGGFLYDFTLKRNKLLGYIWHWDAGCFSLWKKKYPLGACCTGGFLYNFALKRNKLLGRGRGAVPKTEVLEQPRRTHIRAGPGDPVSAGTTSRLRPTGVHPAA